MNTDVQRTIAQLRTIVELPEKGPIASLYLYGSASRGDFRRGLSDLDFVAIGTKEVHQKDLAPLVQAAEQAASEIGNRVSVRLLYRDELEGAPPRGRLGRLISPPLLARDARGWVFVAGSSILEAALVKAPLNPAEEVHLRFVALQSRLRRHRADSTAEPARYVIVEAAHLAHALHEVELGPRRFSYHELRRSAQANTAAIVEAALRCRHRGWLSTDCEACLGEAEQLCDRFT